MLGANTRGSTPPQLVPGAAHRAWHRRRQNADCGFARSGLVRAERTSSRAASFLIIGLAPLLSNQIGKALPATAPL